MSQAEQHELPAEEGGGRLNWLLAVLVLVVAIVMGIVLAAGVQSSGVSSQSSASSDPGDASETANKGEVADLLSHGGKIPDVAPALPLSPPPAKLPVVMTQQPPHNPSPYEQWAEQKYMKALESPQVVTAFHSPALELPQAQSQSAGSSVAFGDSGGTPAIRLHPAPSPYAVIAGNVIPAVLVSGIDSDLPGPIVAQVRENVFDSATGRYLLVPQGSRLLGSYQNASAYGQQRVQIAWQRLIFPNTSSMDIAGMPGADQSGYVGFSDQVDNHYLTHIRHRDPHEHHQRGPDGRADQFLRKRDVLALRLCAAESVGDGGRGCGHRNERTARTSRAAVAAARNESSAHTDHPARLPVQRDRDPGPRNAGSVQELGSEPTMKLKLREKELPPVQLRLVVPAGLKKMLDKYVAFVHEGSGREVEAREIAVEMLVQFMVSDRQFKHWQRRDQKLALQRGLRGSQSSVQVNGEGSA